MSSKVVNKGKVVKARIKFKAIPVKGATPAPPLGPALGQKGVNIQEFIKVFNDKSASFDPSYKLRAKVCVYEDRTFDCVVYMPETSWLIKQRVSGDSLKKEDAMEIARIKMNDMGVIDIGSAYRTVVGVAKSMKLKIAE